MERTPFDAAKHQRKADEICCRRLKTTIRNLEKLADGEVEEIEEEHRAAGTISVGTGPNLVRPFEGRRADEMICVRRKVVRSAPDRAANIYLADRALGKVKERPMEEGAVSDDVQLAFEADVIRAYGDYDDDNQEQ